MSSENDVEQRREWYFSGRVQGVGFRYTARSIAASYHVTGFVKNLPDGRVYLVVEGTTAEIRKYLREIEAELGHCIAAVNETVLPYTGGFADFEVRF